MAMKGKWTRIGTVLHQLDCTWKDIQSNLKPGGNENVEALRVACAKLLDILSNKDKSCKDFLKHTNAIPQLFEILKYSSGIDQQITISIVESLNHVASQGKGLNILLGAGIVQTLSECVATAASNFLGSSNFITEDLFISLYTLMLKISNKDKRFSTISRIAGGIDASVMILKSYSTHTKIASTVVQVMKIYTTSVVNCGIMVKGGIVTLVMKMLHACGQKKIQLLKNLLDLLGAICRTKVGAKKAVHQGVIPLMLAMYQESLRYDHRNRNAGMRRSLLLVIKACVAYGFGTKAFLAANGYRTLYFLGLEALDNREMESSLRVIILILRKCTRNNKLPLHNNFSTYSFRLPAASKKETDTASVDEKEEEYVMLKVDEETSDEESNDGDNAELEESSEERDEAEHEEKDEGSLDTSIQSNLNSKDLEQFKIFVEEFYSFQNSADGDGSDDYIRIPTASLDDIVNDSREEFDSDINLHTNSFEDVSLEGATNDLTRRTLSESNIFYRNFQSLSVEGEEIETDGEDGELNLLPLEVISKRPSSSTLFSIDKSSCVIFEDTVKLNYYKDIKRKLTDLEYQPDIFKTSLIQTSSDVVSDKRNNTPVELVSSSDPVISVCPFIQTALPDVFGHLHHVSKRLHNKKANIQRIMMFQDFSRNIFPEQLISHVVYDLDKLLGNNNSNNAKCKYSPDGSLSTKPHSLKKSQSVPRLTSAKRRQCVSVLNRSLKEEGLPADHLVFESRFESGNLRKAIHIRQFEYDLLLNSDVNTDHHHQWFYFQVEKMEAGVQYRFNIINCEKPNSQFNFGMQPLCYSLKRAMDGNPQWERVGSDICYYKNYYVRKAVGKYYHTATFSVRFPYANDTCYLSYHYPFTLSMLNVELQKLEESLSHRVYYRNQVLCQTLGGNNVNLITITDTPSSRHNAIAQRPYVVLTARVHPGESNSSWIMKGVLDFLVSCDENAAELRAMYVFKIIPMLNPDGVVNGCHRCSLSGQDLNRQWKAPDEALHPSIYYAKSVLELLVTLNKRPLVFVDFHGHSRKKNIFLYGCSMRKVKSPSTDEESHTPNNSNDSDSPNTLDNDLYSGSDVVKMLPRIMSTIAPCFSLQSCNFAMEKSKEATARIVGFKELGITHCFTMESTYSGMDQGLYKGSQVGTRELEEMGWHFCLSLLKFGHSLNI